MTDVEQAHPLAHGAMLFQQAGVLNGHVHPPNRSFSHPGGDASRSVAWLSEAQAAGFQATTKER